MLQLTWTILAILAVNADKIPRTDAEATAPTTTTTTTTITSAAAHTTIDNVSGTTTEVFPPTSCKGLKNGTHALGACSQKYFSCWSGIMFSFRCLDGLAFSEDLGECIFKYRIPECNDHSFVPIPTSPPVVDFCKEKTDGWYGNGCNVYFYVCVSSVTHKLLCPSELFYNAETTRCDFMESIVACGAKPEQTTTATTTDVPVVDVTEPLSSDSNNPQTDAETTAPSTTTTTTTITSAAAHTTIDNVVGTTTEVSPPASCEGLKNGSHALGACSEKYFTCWSGIYRTFRCIEGLVFSKTRGECVFRWRIPECHAESEAFVPVPTSPPVGSFEIQRQVDFCKDKTNGRYGNGCNRYFYVCDGNITYKWTCPGELFYEAESRRCDYKELIVACGAKPKKTTTATTTEAPATDVTEPSSSDNNYCQEKPNGFFGTACNNYFYFCSDGSTFRLPCPGGHYFDDDKKRCTKKEMITACGPTTAMTTTTTTTTTDTEAPVGLGLDRLDVICVGKPDGLHSNGCSVTYFSCAGEISTTMSCAYNHLRFDVTRNLCDHPVKVQECGGSLTITPSEPKPTPSFASGVANPAPGKKAAFICSGKADGFYAISTCSKFYARCFSNTAYIKQCPAHLAFNYDKELCDYKENIPACPEAQPTVPTVRPTFPTTVPTLTKVSF